MAGTIRIQETGKTFTFDTTLDESRVQSATVTEHPIDVGLPVTDHRQPLPLTIEITGRVTESPFPEQQINTNATAQALARAATQLEPVVVEQPPEEGPDRIEYAQKFLEEASEGGLLTWVGAKYGTIENLLIEQITTNIVREGHLDFEISFKQVRLARAQFFDIPPIAVPKPSVVPEVQECVQPVQEEPDPEKEYTPSEEDPLPRPRSASRQFLDSYNLSLN